MSSAMTASIPAASGRIFISYRREETAYPAGWLFDRLAERYGRDQVFKDVDSLELGDDPVDAIVAAVGSCEVLLALIGDRWLTITDQEGRRRLDDPEDFVRLEIEAALRHNVRVIPILLQGARLPQVGELPPSLAALVRLQALEVSPRFEVAPLLSTLDSQLRPDPPPQIQFHVDTLPDRSAVRDADLPLTIEGRYSGDAGIAVRVILEDSYGQYYVQNPEVKLLSDGTWRATNVLPGDGIMYVHFVGLKDAGKRFFDQMVERHAFGAFREMPTGSQILRSVTIHRMT
jgi:TIR domain-containing protein